MDHSCDPRDRRVVPVDLGKQAVSDVPHVPGDGFGPDVDPVTGDEAETEESDDDDPGSV